MGNGSVIRPGDVQRMTAGTGVSHSEFNHSSEDRIHLLQIWILPEQNGLQPGYQQAFFAAERKHNQWRLLGSRDGRDGSLTIHQDVDLYASRLEKGHSLEHRFAGHRRGFLQVVAGAVESDGQHLAAGDALMISDQATLTLQATEDSELLLFDLA
jgi:redox-sensitive bicupin YhaK (pirin superfamily)